MKPSIEIRRPNMDEEKGRDEGYDGIGPANGHVPEPEGLQGVALAVVMTSICLSMFLVSLDRTIIATAIPSMTNQFHSFEDIAWYGSAYMLTGCVMQLPLGMFYKIYPAKIVYITSVVIFEVGSAVCGGAPNSEAVIVGRAIQGFGSAGIFSGSMVLIVKAVPLSKRAMYTGFLGAIFGVSAVAGPLLGGALTTHASWRWCFLINLPIGGVVLVIIFFIFPKQEERGGKKGDESAGAQAGRQSLLDKVLQFNPLGFCVLVPAVVCLLLALQWGGSAYPWSSGRVIALLVMSGVLFIAFGIDQALEGDRAMIKTETVKQRTVAAAFAFSNCIGGAMMTVIYYIPIWFQGIKSVSAVKSGEMSFPLLIALVLGSILSGALVSKLVGYPSPFMIAGAVLMAVGAGLLSTFTVSTEHPKWIGYQVLFGIGLGCCMQHGSNAVQAVLPKSEVPPAISLLFFGQQLGGSVFLSIAQNIMSQELINNVKSQLPDVDASMIVKSGATDLRDAVSSDKMSVLLHVYNDAVVNVFYLAAALAGVGVVVALFVEWKDMRTAEVDDHQESEKEDL
ncbi:MDR family MFS transporter [Aspergillus affinis]|uniref:MDR family MFS transporter n=1 Tax=Aspergillus affinis TaxID=1070780 RepID=UPI0022FF1810|nr:MFS general substrate transporter [Aspergillus affinis]KAI9039274.1 MFS general substrate transporter [Aspergillus affinis]